MAGPILRSDAKDLRGESFGKLTVIAPDWRDGKRVWRCQCVCGKEVLFTRTGLEKGASPSCGCSRKTTKTHGKSDDRDYQAWRNMKSRCYLKTVKEYEYYGARGISVCARWRDSFEAFMEDMGERPSPDHSLDRIDNDGDYTPENCRWASRVEQMRNRRGVTLVEWNGEQERLADLCEQFGIKTGTAKYRIKKGWSVVDAVSTPLLR
jgi:hypothetical protein